MKMARVITENNSYDIAVEDLGKHTVEEANPSYSVYITDFTYRDQHARSEVCCTLAEQSSLGVAAFRHSEDLALLESLVYEFDKSSVQSIEILPLVGTSWRMLNSNKDQ